MKRGLYFCVLLTSLVAVGCHPASGRPAVMPAQALPATVTAAPVSDQNSGRALHAVLYSTEASSKRLSLLAGVVQHQLAQGARRFDAGFRDEGFASVRGALLLVRAGEARDAMWQGGSHALETAAHEAARRGNEGQAQALYSLLLRAKPTAELKAATELHLSAIRDFDDPSHRHGAVEASGMTQRIAANRALLDPTPENLKVAADATLSWLRTAMHSDVTERFAEANFDREEAVQAFRAIRSGAATIGALYLRHGDAQGALEFIEVNDLGRVVPTPLRTRLDRAANGGDLQAFADLFRLYQTATEADEPETAIDEDIAAGAAFGLAVELYRRAPDNISAAGALAALMIEYGMQAGIAHLLVPAVGKNPSVETLDYAIELVEQGLNSLGRISDVTEARRLLADSAPLIAAAGQPRLRSHFETKVARLHFLLGAIETREGNLEQAQSALNLAAHGQPQVETWALLAQVQRQLGDNAGALGSLARLVEMCREKALVAAEAEALTQTYELELQQGHTEQAHAALARALHRALDARQMSRTPPEQARAERMLARALELFGDVKGAERGLLRALDAARADSAQYTANILDSGRMALTHENITQAREAVREAKQGGLQPEDSVYLGAWLRVLERLKREPGDGTVEDAIGNLSELTGWPAKLRAWAMGQIDVRTLAGFAVTPSQKTEALFYRAMQARVDGNLPEQKSLLEQVLRSPSVELVEITIARDLLRAAAHTAPPKLPTDVTLP